MFNRRNFFRILSAGLLIGGVSLPSANAGNVSKSLNDIFPNAAADGVSLNTFNNSNSLTGSTVYKEMMVDCRGFGNPNTCNAKVAFGKVNTPGAPDSQRGMNRMIILSPTGNRRFEEVTISGGNVQYNSSLVRENEIGFINIAYFKGTEATPFNRCDAEIVVCGSNVVGCPQASANPVCAPVVAANTNINHACHCPTGQMMSSCVNNIPTCETVNPSPSCAPDEVYQAGSCLKAWSCNTLTSAELALQAAACPESTVELTRADHYPTKIFCSGTKACNTPDCAPGTKRVGSGPTAKCEQCLEGTYTPDMNMSTCLPCGSGTVAAFPGATSCSTCEAGKYAVDAKECKTCEAGTYSLGGTSSCTSCQRPNVPGAAIVDVTSPPGATDSSKCSYKVTSCVAGYTLNADGMSCTQSAAPGKCGKGQYLAAGGTCAACAAGTYQDSVDHTNNSCKPCSVTNGSFPMAAEGATSLFADAGSSEPSCGELKCNSGTVISADSKSCKAYSCPFYAVPFSNTSSTTGTTTYSQFEGKSSGIISDMVFPASPGYSMVTPLDPYVGQCHQYSYYTLKGSCDASAKWVFETKNENVNVTPCTQYVFECPSSSVTIEGKTVTFPYGEVKLYRYDVGGDIGARGKYYAWAKVPDGRTTGCGKNNGDACTTPNGKPGKILRISALQNVPFSVTPPGNVFEECQWFPNGYTTEVCECIDP